MSNTCIGCSNLIYVDSTLPAPDALLKQPSVINNGLLCHDCCTTVIDQQREYYAKYMDALPEPEPYAPDTVFIEVDEDPNIT